MAALAVSMAKQKAVSVDGCLDGFNSRVAGVFPCFGLQMYVLLWQLIGQWNHNKNADKNNDDEENSAV